MSDEKTGFISRWNLRRQRVAEEAEVIEAEALAVKNLANESLAPKVEQQGEQVKASQDVALSDTYPQTSLEQDPDVETKILNAEDLPDPEKIEIGGSFASFMAANVSPAAKSAALKALWKQPQYSEIDGMMEYALDYSNQPKLSSEHSAEIAKKLFRHITKDDNEEVQELAQTQAETDSALDANMSVGSSVDPEIVDSETEITPNLDSNLAVSTGQDNDSQSPTNISSDVSKNIDTEPTA